jgi:hypothetical protein
MRFVSPVATVTLRHRAYCVDVACAGVVAGSPQGELTLLRPDLSIASTHSVGGPIEHLALSPDARRVARIVRGRLELIDLSNEARLGIVAEHMLGCAFDASGTRLWCARRASERIMVELRDAEHGSPIASMLLDDPFGESGCMLLRHTDPAAIVAWIAAGQGGQVSFEVHIGAAGLSARGLPPADSLPSFEPDGRAYVAAGSSIVRHSYPELLRMDELTWPFDEGEVPAGDAVVPLGDGTVLWSSLDGLLFRLAHDRGAVVEQIAIVGHEPKPSQEYFPRLVNETQPCTDFSFARMGLDGTVLLVFGDRELVLVRAEDLAV